MYQIPTKPRGVIGNTTDFGSVIQGSSPCGVATFYLFGIHNTILLIILRILINHLKSEPSQFVGAPKY